MNTNATNLRKNLFSILEQAIKYNEPVNVITKDGNVVIISEEEYRGLIETLYLTSSPEMRKILVEGRDAEIEDCLTEDEVNW